MTRIARLFDDLRTDIRYAIRSLFRNKAFTVAVIATLGLGIGANAAVFSVFNAVLIRELPVKNPEELVMFHWLRMPDPMVAAYSGYGRPGPGGAGLRTSFSQLTFERFRDHSTTLASVFAMAPLRDLTVTADGQSEAASGDLASGTYFDCLGVQAGLGRTFAPEDDRPEAEAVAVISHRYWQRRFASDPAVVGKSIYINRTPFVIVGVTPAGFDGTSISETTDVTIPLAMARRISGGASARPVSLWWVQIMGRLRSGVTREQAFADVQRLFGDSVQQSWAARTQTSSKGTSMPQLGIMSGSQGLERPRRDAMPILASIFVVAGTILLIGCVNVANLVLVRTLTRRQELAIRAALGASRTRVLRQVFTESLLLALGGAVAGSVLAIWGRGFLSWLPSQQTPIVDAKIDWAVLLFAAGLSIAAAALFGFLPAVRATRGSLSLSVQPGQRQRRGIVRRSLVVGQVAISLVLLVVAALFVQSVANLGRVDVGFDTRNLLVFRVNPDFAGDKGVRAFQLYDDLTAAIQAVPGVRSTTMSVLPVLAQAEKSASVGPEGGGTASSAYIQGAGPNFFETMGIPVLRGRTLTPADREGAPRVAVINEAMAKQVFDDVNPLGRRFEFLDGPEQKVSMEVVGVVRDAAYARLQEAAPPTLYRPFRQMAPGGMTFEVRTEVEPLSLVPAVQQAVRRVDPALALAAMKSQEQQIGETIERPRTLALVTSACGVVGVLLACIGLYGIVSFDVTRRTSEIGIRMALGARRSDVVRLVLRETAVVVAVGTGIGLIAAVAAIISARSLFYGVSLANPIAVVAAAALLIAAAGVASFLPARRAAALDPTKALRYE
jgi:predicted permease